MKSLPKALVVDRKTDIPKGQLKKDLLRLLSNMESRAGHKLSGINSSKNDTSTKNGFTPTFRVGQSVFVDRTFSYSFTKREWLNGEVHSKLLPKATGQIKVIAATLPTATFYKTYPEHIIILLSNFCPKSIKRRKGADWRHLRRPRNRGAKFGSLKFPERGSNHHRKHNRNGNDKNADWVCS